MTSSWKFFIVSRVKNGLALAYKQATSPLQRLLPKSLALVRSSPYLQSVYWYTLFQSGGSITFLLYLCQPSDGHLTKTCRTRLHTLLWNTLQLSQSLEHCLNCQFRALSRMSIKLEYPINRKKSAFLQTITFSICARTKMTVFNVLKKRYNTRSFCLQVVLQKSSLQPQIRHPQ